MSSVVSVATEEQARTLLRTEGLSAQARWVCRSMTRRSHRCWVFRQKRPGVSVLSAHPVLVVDTGAVVPFAEGSTVDDLLDDAGC